MDVSTPFFVQPPKKMRILLGKRFVKVIYVLYCKRCFELI